MKKLTHKKIEQGKSQIELSNLSRRHTLVLSLLDIFRAHLIKSQFVGKAYQSELSPTSALILDILSKEPSTNIPRLAELLNLNKSTISRSIQSLVDSGYLETLRESGQSAKQKPESTSTNQLRKKLTLTGIGKKFIKLQETFNQKQITSQLNNLTSAEASKLIKLLTKFADDSADPNSVSKLPTETSQYTQMLSAMRRLTIAHGVTSESFLDTDLNSEEWLILSELNGSSLTTSELAQKLSQPITTLAQKLQHKTLKPLIRSRISSTQSPPEATDQRRKPLELSEHGISVLSKFEEAAFKTFHTGLKNFNESTLEDLVLIFREYVGLGTPLRSFWVDSQTQLKKLSSELDFQNARWLLIKYLSSDQSAANTYKLPEFIFSERNLCFGVYNQGQLIAAFEYLQTNNKQLGELINIAKTAQLTDKLQKSITKRLILI